MAAAIPVSATAECHTVHRQSINRTRPFATRNPFATWANALVQFVWHMDWNRVNALPPKTIQEQRHASCAAGCRAKEIHAKVHLLGTNCRTMCLICMQNQVHRATITTGKLSICFANSRTKNDNGNSNIPIAIRA